MFKKPFKIKSNSAIRGSERRKIRDTISKYFPHVTAELMSSMIPNKEEMTVMKVLTHVEENIVCYILNKNPIFFERNGLLIPTVYTLWDYPMLITLTFETHLDVFPRLADGADLLMAGVIPNENQIQYEKNAMCSVYLRGNRAAIAVGRTTFSSQDILSDGVKDKRVSIFHVFHDHLWASGEKLKLPSFDTLPETGNGADEKDKTINIDSTNEGFTANDSLSKVVNQTEIHDDVEITDETGTTECATELSPQETMDNLLRNCFCQSILNAKKVELPILVSTFTSQYLHAVCPEGLKIDVKKSSYKKMSKFLSEMQVQKLVVLKELSKGVVSIVSISLENEMLREYKSSSFAATMKGLKELKLVEDKKEEMEKNQGISVVDLYAVSAKTSAFFKVFNLSKNTILSSADVRKHLNSYIKQCSLSDPNNKKFVCLDPLLTDTLCSKANYEERLSWDTLMNRLLDAMNDCYEVIVPGESPVVRKGRMKPVEISIEQRMGNKKVTVLKNLDTFGINLKQFSQALQHAAASSTSLIDAPGKSNVQYVQVQGIQNKHIKLLLESYKIPKKYIQGLDASSKSKKR